LLILSRKISDLPASGTDILTTQNKVAGKFITVSYNIGLALLRLEYFYSNMLLGKYKVLPMKPFWWPQENTTNQSNQINKAD